MESLVKREICIYERGACSHTLAVIHHDSHLQGSDSSCLRLRVLEKNLSTLPIFPVFNPLLPSPDIPCSSSFNYPSLFFRISSKFKLYLFHRTFSGSDAWISIDRPHLVHDKAIQNMALHNDDWVFTASGLHMTLSTSNENKASSHQDPIRHSPYHK